MEKNIKKLIKITNLPAPLIVKNFVVGENDCNYELYLLELLNASSWFSKKYPGGFHAPKAQEKGQCDAINKSYELDFKLLASKTVMQGKNLTSPTITTSDGIVYYGTGKRNVRLKCTWLHAALRGRTLEDLETIVNNKPKCRGIENDIYSFLNSINKKKNLFLFLSYYLYIDDEVINNEDYLQVICDALRDDFNNALKYREKTTDSKYDTFLSFIFEKEFIICRYETSKFKVIDRINFGIIPTFEKYRELSDSFGRGGLEFLKNRQSKEVSSHE